MKSLEEISSLSATTKVKIVPSRTFAPTGGSHTLSSLSPASEKESFGFLVTVRMPDMDTSTDDLEWVCENKMERAWGDNLPAQEMALLER